VPIVVINYVGSQIGADAGQIENYAERGATRTVHQRTIEQYLGFRLPTEQDFQAIGEWLLERALEHDRPTLLLQLLCEHFLAEKLVRPGFSIVERMVATARNDAEEEIFRRVESIVDEILAEELDGLLQAPEPPVSTAI
jgi:hypothetical protein